MMYLNVLSSIYVETSCAKIGLVLKRTLRTSLKLQPDSHLCHTHPTYGDDFCFL